MLWFMPRYRALHFMLHSRRQGRPQCVAHALLRALSSIIKYQPFHTAYCDALNPWIPCWFENVMSVLGQPLLETARKLRQLTG